MAFLYESAEKVSLQFLENVLMNSLNIKTIINILLTNFSKFRAEFRKIIETMLDSIL